MMFSDAMKGFLVRIFGWVLTIMTVVAFSSQPLCKAWFPEETCSKLHLDPKVIIGYTAIVLNLALLLFNSKLWHTPIGRWLGWKIPDIRGTWKGELEMLQHLPGVHNPGRPILIIMAVRQEAFKIHITLYTEESSSSSVAAEFIKTDHENELIYSYRNETDLRLQSRSSNHIGTAVLKMMSVRPASLDGHYYTDRVTVGRMKLTEFSPKLAASFQDGLNLTYAQRPIIR